MAVLTSLLCVSCRDVYDNIKEFPMKEIVYPARFDSIYGHTGYERVEIDLGKAGRIPSEQMKMGKAKKTVVEFNQNGADTTVVIDSVCSWVNIRGLTQPNVYRFVIYSTDEFDNRSTPTEIALTPYTSVDRDALNLPAPNMVQSTSSVNVQWKSPLSSDLYDMYSYSYSYTDRTGTVRTGSGDGDDPSFVVQNIQRETPVIVEMKSRIVPKVNRNPILDTIDWTSPITVLINGTKPFILLDLPNKETVFSESALPVFSWVKTEEVNNYTLKISDSEAFPAGANTVSIPAGNNNSYRLTQSDLALLIAGSNSVRPVFYWTVTPTNGAADIGTQIRQINIGKKVIPLLPTGNNPSQMTREELPDGSYKFVTSGGNPTVYSSNINKIINPGISTVAGNLTFSFEYKASADFRFELFFSTPNVVSGNSAEMMLQRSDSWQQYTLDIGENAGLWEWGKESNHRFRFDLGDFAGITVYLRNIQVNIR
jgi:hypothetical protein